MNYKIGDEVVLQGVFFEEYNNKLFAIDDIEIISEDKAIYRVAKNGFDPIWVTKENFA